MSVIPATKQRELICQFTSKVNASTSALRGSFSKITSVPLAIATAWSVLGNLRNAPSVKKASFCWETHVLTFAQMTITKVMN
jgi:hypothetical protein